MTTFRGSAKRTVVLCLQIVSALAIMMDMKKGVVNETVKENRADELSAMFNMMIDNRKRIMGKWQRFRFRSRHQGEISQDLISSLFVQK